MSLYMCITLPITNKIYPLSKYSLCKLLEKYQLIPDPGLCSVKILRNSI